MPFELPLRLAFPALTFSGKSYPDRRMTSIRSFRGPGIVSSTFAVQMNKHCTPPTSMHHTTPRQNAQHQVRRKRERKHTQRETSTKKQRETSTRRNTSRHSREVGRRDKQRESSKKVSTKMLEVRQEGRGYCIKHIVSNILYKTYYIKHIISNILCQSHYH